MEGMSFSGQRYIDPFDPESSVIHEEQYTVALSPMDWAHLMGELERSLEQALAELSLSRALSTQQRNYSSSEAIRAKERIAEHLIVRL